MIIEADILKYYKELNVELCNNMRFPDKKTREYIKSKFRNKFGSDIEVKCDEENNTPDIINSGHINFKIKFNIKHTHLGSTFETLELMFGTISISEYRNNKIKEILSYD